MLTDYLENQIKKKIEAAAPLYTVEDDFPKTQSWMDSVMKRIKCIVSKHEIQAIIDEYCYYTPVEDMIQGKNVHQNPELVFVYHELAKQIFLEGTHVTAHWPRPGQSIYSPSTQRNS
jgi:hypothetical protein